MLVSFILQEMSLRWMSFPISAVTVATFRAYGPQTTFERPSWLLVISWCPGGNRQSLQEKWSRILNDSHRMNQNKTRQAHWGLAFPSWVYLYNIRQGGGMLCHRWWRTPAAAHVRKAKALDIPEKSHTFGKYSPTFEQICCFNKVCSHAVLIQWPLRGNISLGIFRKQTSLTTS